MTTSGIGLGISTSYKIAKAMGGDLNIVSQVKIPNQNVVSGTQVTMTIQCFSVGQNNIEEVATKFNSHAIAAKPQEQKKQKNRIIFGEDLNLEKIQLQQ